MCDTPRIHRPDLQQQRVGRIAELRYVGRVAHAGLTDQSVSGAAHLEDINDIAGPGLGDRSVDRSCSSNLDHPCDIDLAVLVDDDQL